MKGQVLKAPRSIPALISRRTGTFAGMLGVLIVLLTVLEVVARYVFNSPTVWTYEITTYLLASLVFVGLGYTTLVRGHVRVDLIVDRLSKRKQAIVKIVTSTMAFIYGLILASAIAVVAWEALQRSAHSMTVLSVPLFPIYLVLLIGALWFCVQLAVGIGRE